jgi:type I restriction enzyme S subunit
LEAGDVLVVEGHADPEQIGRSAVVEPELAGLFYQNHLFRLRFDEVIPEFAMLWLNSRKVRAYWKEQCATSSGLYTINSKLLENVPFPRVGRADQERVVAAWQSANEAVHTLRRQIDKLRVIQQSVVEELLTGKVRVPVAA